MSLRPSAAEDGRYTAELADGSRIGGNDLKDWNDEKQKPALEGRAVFDDKNPFRWLIDHSLSSASEPGAFVEFFGGDRLPGQVVGFETGQASSYLASPKHLIVNPSIPLHSPKLPGDSPVRVTTAWIKRVVWEPRTLDLYEPGHVFLKDGRQIGFRSLRWAEKSFTLLLDEGIQEVFFGEVMEIHFPLQDVWETYSQQMAVLSPPAPAPDQEARIMQLETSDGLKATVSTARLKPLVHGNKNEISSWHHQCQPAWSLDPLWVRFDRVWCRRFYWPHQVPLSVIAPLGVQQESPLGDSWYWQQDRSVYRQPLKSGGKSFGWGFGVHAFHEIRFPLPASARSFRTRAGLDQSVGAGGCVRWQISLRGGEEKTLHQSPVVRGTDQILDTGRLPIEPAKDPKSAQMELVLSVDPLLSGAPAGADPLDIRDSLNWLEPELELDRDQLRRDIARQSISQIPALADWELETPADSLVLENGWDEYDREDPRYRVLLGTRGPFLSLTKSLAIGTQDRWLVLAVNRLDEKSPRVSLQVHIDGAAIAELDVPAARDARGPDPLLIPIESFRGRNVAVRLVQFPTPGAGPSDAQQPPPAFAVDWRGISTSPHRPGLLSLLKENTAFLGELSEGEGIVSLDSTAPYSGETSVKVTPPERGQSRLPGVEIPIRALPRLGEYRYISFAWKKTDGTDIGLGLAHEGILGGEEFGDVRPRIRRVPNAGAEVRPRRPLESPGRGLEFGYRYLRGRGGREQAPALKLDRKLPNDWQRVERDLFGDFGEFTLTGFSLLCPNGESAWFDEIYLARDPRDFEHLPSRKPEESRPQDANVLADENRPERFGLVTASLTGPFAVTGEGVRILKEHQGKTNVLWTRPRDKNTPAVLRAPLILPPDRKSRLELEVHRHPEGDWKLIVLANGEKLEEKLINKDAAGETWAAVSVDLSKFAGQPLLLELQNAPTDWNHEEAYWSQIRVNDQ